MKVAFFGTSDRSMPIVESLASNFGLVLCVTKADTLVGREKKVRETAVKLWSKKHKVEYLCLESIKTSANKVIQALRDKDIELCIVTDFSFIIPKEIIETPKYGFINIHFSLLPQLRGASPIQHAILQGLTETGITYYLLDEKMDTGDILYQIRYPLTQRETSGYLYEKLFSLASENLAQVINLYIKGKITPQPQDHQQASYCYSETHPLTTYIFKEDARINWKEDPIYIERKIRAFYPWPIAWTTLGELSNNHKIASLIHLKTSAYPNLRVKITSAELEHEKLRIKKLQVEGKNEVDWMSFVNGYAVRM